MSTYLAAFVVCDYKSKTVMMSGNKPFSVFLPKHLLNDAEFPALTGRDAMNYFINYLDVDFSLPKIGKC